MENNLNLILIIRKLTRKYKFNFNEVQNDLNNNYNINITTEECRRIFALDYNENNNNNNFESNNNQSNNSNNSNDSNNSSNNSNQSNNSNNDSNNNEVQSFSDVLKKHEEIRRQNDEKLDNIFKRVLNALETTEKIELNDNDEVIIARKQIIEERENERIRKRLIEEEQREQQLFQDQRAKLKKRFDVDSEDSQGIDPLAIKSEKNNEDDDITAFVTPQMTSSFNIEALLNSNEFDLLLTSIERDLDEKASLVADSKTGDEEISELGDVILFLTKTAEEKSLKYEQNIERYHELLPTDNQSLLPTAPPKVNNSQSTSSSAKMLPPPSIESKSKSNSNNINTSTTTPSSSSSTTSTLSSSTSTLSTTTTVSKERQTQNREVSKNGNSYGGRGRGGMQSKQATSSSENRQNDDDDDNDNDDSDDDNDWRKNRNKIKSKKVEEISSKSTNKSDSLQSQSQSQSTFWNVHGPPSASLRTSTNSSKYVTKTPPEFKLVQVQSDQEKDEETETEDDEDDEEEFNEKYSNIESKIDFEKANLSKTKNENEDNDSKENSDDNDQNNNQNEENISEILNDNNNNNNNNNQSTNNISTSLSSSPTTKTTTTSTISSIAPITSIASPVKSNSGTTTPSKVSSSPTLKNDNEDSNSINESNRVGGILGSSSNRTKRTKGNKLIGSVEVAKKRLETTSSTSISTIINQKNIIEVIPDNSPEISTIQQQLQEQQQQQQQQSLSPNVKVIEENKDNIENIENIESNNKEPIKSIPTLESIHADYPPFLPYRISTLFNNNNTNNIDGNNIVLNDSLKMQKLLKECQSLTILEFNLNPDHQIISDKNVLKIFERSDIIIYSIISWVISKLNDLQAKISGIILHNLDSDHTHQSLSTSISSLSLSSTSSSSTTTPSTENKQIKNKFLTLIIEGKVPNSNIFISKSLLQALQITRLSDILNSKYFDFQFYSHLSSFGTILTPEKSVETLTRLVQTPSSILNLPSISPNLSNSIEINEKTLQNIYNNLNKNIVCCVFKSYLLFESSTFQNIFELFELNGLRLCGFRTGYIDSTNHEFHKLLHPDIFHIQHTNNNNNNNNSNLNYDYYIKNKDTNEIQEISSIPVLVVLFYSSKHIAIEVVRNLLGPEDPMLARRTDPESIRSKCGGLTRNENICYPLPSLYTNNWKDILFWFGPRQNEYKNDFKTSISPTILNNNNNNNNPQLLNLPEIRYCIVGISIESLLNFETSSSSTTLSSNNETISISNESNTHIYLFSYLQKLCLTSLEIFTSSTMNLLAIWSSSRAEHIKYGLTVMSDENYNNNNNGNNNNNAANSYFILVLSSYISDIAIQSYYKKLLTKINESMNQFISKYYHVNISYRIKDKFKRNTMNNNIQSTSHSLQLQMHMNRILHNIDFNSHEDIGLEDVIVCSIPVYHYQNSESNNSNDFDDNKSQNLIPYLIPIQEIVYYILNNLPSSCTSSILGINTPNWEHNSLIGDKIYICFRGLHLLENITSAIQLSIDYMNKLSLFSSDSLFISNESRVKLIPQLSQQDIKVLKGKRALDVICREFLTNEESLDYFLSYFTLQTSKKYVPSWITSPQSQSQLQLQLQSQNYNFTTLFQKHTEIVRSLFNPGYFHSISVIIIPYPLTDNSTGGIFFRVFKKLEKENFSIKYVKSCIFTDEMANYCTKEIQEDEYIYDLSNILDNSDIFNNFNSLINKPVLAIIVSGNSALLRLRSIIGPIDPVRALEHYPSSIIGNLASFVQSDSPNRQPKLLYPPPYVFFSRTCQSTEYYIKNFLSLNFSSYDCNFFPSLTNGLDSDNNNNNNNNNSNNSNTNELEYEIIGDKDHIDQIQRILKEESLKSQHHRDKVVKKLIFENSSVSNLSTMSSNDATCLVLTSSLMHFNGISPIFAAVHKEGIKVIHAYSEVIHPTIGKKLMDLAGQSSLSMKPSLNILLSGSCLFLALEGTSHSILRLKSILQQPSTNTSNFSHSIGSSQGKSQNSTAIGKLLDGSWGLLASSSSRLAHDLLTYSFDKFVASSLCSIEISESIEVISTISNTSFSSIQLNSQQPLTQSQSQLQSQDILSNSSSPLRNSTSSPINYLTPKQSPIKLSNPLSGIGYYTPPTEEVKKNVNNDEDLFDFSNKQKIQYEFTESKDEYLQNITSKSLIIPDGNEELENPTQYKLEELD